MTPPSKELPFKWRQVATPVTVTAAAFAQLVLENKLTTYCHGGYCWAAKEGEDWFDLYRTFDGDWSAVAISQAATGNPAAGAATVSTITVPAGRRWRIIQLTVTLVADANVSDRYMYVGVKPNGATFTGYFVSSLAQTANLTVAYTFADCAAGGAVGAGNVCVPMPEMVLNAGATLTIGYAGGQATDDAAATYYAYREVLL